MADMKTVFPNKSQFDEINESLKVLAGTKAAETTVQAGGANASGTVGSGNSIGAEKVDMTGVLPGQYGTSPTQGNEGSFSSGLGNSIKNGSRGSTNSGAANHINYAMFSGIGGEANNIMPGLGNAGVVSGFIKGTGCELSGWYATSLGLFTQAFGSCQLVGGMFNTPYWDYGNPWNTSNRLFILGNGRGTSSRSNAMSVDPQGNIYALGSTILPGADYAEMYEWADGNPDAADRRGIFVTLSGNKIVPATAEDDYILGIVSARPTVIGDAPDTWQGRWLTDVYGERLHGLVAYYDTLHGSWDVLANFGDERLMSAEHTVTDRAVHMQVTPTTAGAVLIQFSGDEEKEPLNLKNIRINGKPVKASYGYFDTEQIYFSRSLESETGSGTQNLHNGGFLILRLDELSEISDVTFDIADRDTLPEYKVQYSESLIADDFTGIDPVCYEFYGYMENPDYDPEQEYISREKRPEWAAIGTHGKLVVDDDGTCEVNGYCWPSENGVATADTVHKEYRVIERVDESHVRVVLK